MKTVVSLFIFILLAISCRNSKYIEKEPNTFAGKMVFAEYSCGACHYKTESDHSLFSDFREELMSKDRRIQGVLLRSVLNNEDHLGKGVKSNQLTDGQLTALLDYLLEIREKKIIN